MITFAKYTSTNETRSSDAFLAVFVYTTHATQAIAFEWKPGFTLEARSLTTGYLNIGADVR